MPYIARERRLHLDEELDVLCDKLDSLEGGARAGDLNYVITSLILASWRHSPSYARGNTLMGVLSCVAREFYRRHLAPYEEEKIRENGDV